MSEILGTILSKRRDDIVRSQHSYFLLRALKGLSESPFDNMYIFPHLGLGLVLGQVQTQESDPDRYQKPIRNPAECILK